MFFFVLFIIFFIRVTFPLPEKDLTTNLFFNIDPLIALSMALTGTLIKTAFIGSLALVILTVIFGRFFCGWICPMGTLFDLAARIFPVKQQLRGVFGSSPYKNIKYYLLSFTLFATLAGFSAALFFDPLVFFFRALTLNVYPFFVLIVNLGLNIIRPLAVRFGFFKLSILSYDQPVYHLGFLHLFLLLIVIGLITVEKRFWCRNICPFGALLALIGRFSPWGRHVSSACNACSRCARSCPMNAIGEDFFSTSNRECIQCEKCAEICPQSAIYFGFHADGKRIAFNPSRRHVILASTSGIITGITAGSSIATRTTTGTLIRPPGALIESDFLDACVRCGECMKVCPTHGLQPATFQAGFEGLFGPLLIPRIGACEEQCNLCGRVCPTGAVRDLPLKEKQYAVMGNAVIDRSLCIAWEQLKLCLICDEACPYDAIDFRMVTDEKGTLQRPFVIEEKCVGCGQCENKCPVKGSAAIYITPIGEVRKNSGSYITEHARKLREESKDEDVDFYRDTGTLQDNAIPGTEQQPKEPEDELPPGFIP